ncbi:glutathione ABC transporter ATP-binding protein [Tessaracoccus lapidicaptus]|uniref:Glutathione ABC transporter ATP-binding protein n=1 Tax=Tessaracoccus lapidicaptus TaxID=1427523 RepID=A0A1C0APW9_9ACTN|nr:MULTISPECIES: ABC transporter ATP-binding protein [Tessaracoccus]AQX15220.1 glutathione ABC transporter ATP-binding protein [Tessaracoccus sp. T2.5-30]OCL36468.1 glutathione ABC transporter ATP-binding protein [Tessaracoccus lapidicaptus]VEP39466.1 Glutathione import ATP-binding protein GsiA [Tessaracoccus lapidicaptus]
MTTTPRFTGENPVLKFDKLDVQFRTEFGTVHAVKGITLSVEPGEVMALVGESGSGKSVTATTALGLLPKTARIQGDTRVTDKSIGQLSGRQLRSLRGNRVAMVFQEPMTALNPVITVGEQLTEAMEVHGVAFGRDAWDRAVDLLNAVGIPNAERRAKQFPHELSGGMRQRVVIAMALACDPDVIIADEPTTALDVTVQAEILDLLRSLKDKLNTGILLITHNMGVVADMADNVAVMFKGTIVERGPVEQVLLQPQHPYTKRLLAAVPRLGEGHGQFGVAPNPVEPTAEAALDVRDLVVEYHRAGKKPFRAVDGVSFDVRRGEIVGLVGESGSGKSTIGRALLGLIPSKSGEVRVLDQNLLGLRGHELKSLRKRIGVIFQDPAASLNPRFPIGDVIAEPMSVHKVGNAKEREARVHELLDAVQLPRSVYNRYPHELSGGQRQRVSIARALSLSPDLLVADEPTSALDVSVQASVLAMFTELQREFGFACLFISHDLAVIDSLAHRVVVMQYGKIVEKGTREDVLLHPQEEYTRRLLAAAPVPDPIEQRERREARYELLKELGDEVVELDTRELDYDARGPRTES